ncbi:MAG: ABC transporter permease, partial [Acidobacteria bacterium]|nr:ABC transporter permease [Acidobacteriota bacterium]
RGRIVQPLLTESLTLATAGGMVGMVLVHWMFRLMPFVLPPGSLPRAEGIAIDLRVFALAFGLSLLAGVLCGGVPAFFAARSGFQDLNRTLKDTVTAASGSGRSLRSALVVTEVSLALVLLASAGLLVRSYLALRDVDVGVRMDKVLTASLALAPARYPGMEERGAFIHRLLERLRNNPRIESITVTNSLPVAPAASVSVHLEIAGRTNDAAAGYRTVTPEYFRMLEIGLVKGRLFDETDSRGTTAIVNEAFVQRYWPNESARSTEPLGRRLKFNQLNWEIVGVVRNIRFWGRRSEPEPEIYVSHTQNSFPDLTLLLRTAEPMARMAPALRAAVTSLDPDQALARIETMDAAASAELATPRFYMLIVGAYGALALLLAALGINAAIGYSVAQRRREIGIRMAMGASSFVVLRSVLWDAARLCICGGVAGAGIAMASAKLLSNLLFGVKPTDPIALGSVAALLVIAGIAAAWFPACRAVRTDPATVLRSE